MDLHQSVDELLCRSETPSKYTALFLRFAQEDSAAICFSAGNMVWGGGFSSAQVPSETPPPQIRRRHRTPQILEAHRCRLGWIRVYFDSALARACACECVCHVDVYAHVHAWRRRTQLVRLISKTATTQCMHYASACAGAGTCAWFAGHACFASSFPTAS